MEDHHQAGLNAQTISGWVMLHQNQNLSPAIMPAQYLENGVSTTVLLM